MLLAHLEFNFVLIDVVLCLLCLQFVFINVAFVFVLCIFIDISSVARWCSLVAYDRTPIVRRWMRCRTHRYEGCALLLCRHS